MSSIAEKYNRKNRLVVLVPGFRGHSSKWKKLRDRLAQEPGYEIDETHWVPFDHQSSLFSLGGIRKLARALRAQIDAEWLRADGYDEVILVGHSMGGPLVREAYLLAAGGVLGEEPSKWTEYVTRLVLFASINRGLDTTRIWWMRPAAWLVRNLTFLSIFRIFDLYRGSSFLTNLRINWIRHFGALAASRDAGETWGDGREKEVPKVIQLLGTEDGIVSPEDSKDVLALPRGHDLTVPEANHRNIYLLDNFQEELRYAVIREAFCGEFDEKRTHSSSPGINRVVFLLHGIRASNVDDWITDLEKSIAMRDPEHTIVKHPTYGYFTAARFTLPSVRRRNIAVFQDWYTEALAEYPTAEFSIIAHSNGTYILGHSLFVTPGMRFTNVALVGSVLPRDFWQRFKGRLKTQIKRICNHRANRDWPVALLCSALRGLLMHDVGVAGFAGFNGDSTDEVAYYIGGHGEALKPDHHNSLVDFMFDLDVNKPTSLQSNPGVFRQLSNAAPYASVLIVVACIVAVSWYVLFGVYGDPLVRSFIAAAIVSSVYIILDVI